MDILNVDKITDEKWLNLFSATYRHGDHTGRWVFASRKPTPHVGHGRTDAVLMVPTLVNPNEPRRLVLIDEYRVPVGGRVLAFPAGLLEEGESIEEAAKREMVEETGFEVVQVKQVTPPMYQSAGMTDESIALAFLDVRSTPESKAQLDASEDIQVVLWDYEQICARCDAQDVHFDAKTWLVLHLCRVLGRII